MPRKKTEPEEIISEEPIETLDELEVITQQEETAPQEPVPERRGFYQLDFNELDRDLSPEERQEWNSIYASFRSRSVLSGTVVGVDRHELSSRENNEAATKEMYCAIVIPFRVRILIPEAEMWPEGQDRPSFVLRNMPGANIDFVIIHVDREGGFAIGSRRLAMSTRRYFFSTQPSLNRLNARVKCRVLAVGPRRCLVECYGFDINLTQREMRYTAIPDLRTEYHCRRKTAYYRYGSCGPALPTRPKGASPY